MYNSLIIVIYIYIYIYIIMLCSIICIILIRIKEERGVTLGYDFNWLKHQILTTRDARCLGNWSNADQLFAS